MTKKQTSSFKTSSIHRSITIGFMFVFGILLMILSFQDPRIDDSYSRYSATIVDLQNQKVKVLYDTDKYATVTGRMDKDQIGDTVMIYRYSLFPHYTFIQGRDCTNTYGVMCIFTSIILAILSFIEYKTYRPKYKGGDIYDEY